MVDAPAGTGLRVVAFALLVSAGAVAAEIDIDPFDYATAAEAQAAWAAMAGSPPASVADGGPWGAQRLTVFPCDFTAPERERCYWDRAVALDLTPYPVFGLRVYCDLPSPVSSFTLYFGSGDGWYGCSAALPHPGWNDLIFQRADFEVEGSPAGWNLVDRIRLSPWRGSETNTTRPMSHGDKNTRPISVSRRWRLILLGAGA